MSSFNIGDMLYQLFFIGFIVLIICLIVSIFRSSKKRRMQMDRLEEKIDALNEQLREK
ncbi:resistance to Congo red protein [Peribacillus sp. NPDC097675]|uniref:resistance to Congo red protein n=1 Tax=Peribacillus sp. NPDC097675 TaxID=3390618 RepID=UPI003CFE31B2